MWYKQKNSADTYKLHFTADHQSIFIQSPSLPLWELRNVLFHVYYIPRDSVSVCDNSTEIALTAGEEVQSHESLLCKTLHVTALWSVVAVIPQTRLNWLYSDRAAAISRLLDRKFNYFDFDHLYRFQLLKCEDVLLYVVTCGYKLSVTEVF